MRTLDDFDVSDLAASTFQGWRVRWGAENTGMVLLVDMNTPKQASDWVLVTLPEDNQNITGHVIYDEEVGRFFEKADEPGVQIYSKHLKDIPVEKLPRILRKCFEDHYSDIPAPRFESEKSLLTKQEAFNLESQFYKKCIEPYLDTHQVYSVSKSGTWLAKRLHIKSTEIVVKHYDDNTFQNDSGIKIDAFLTPSDTDTPILIIDDMVSSGRTAEAIIRRFEKLGFSKIRFSALFNVAASREVFSFESYLDLFKTISNFYWVYGRGMDLFDDSSRMRQGIYGADKRFGWESEEDIHDLRNFFSQQS